MGGVLAVLCACRTRVTNIFRLFDADGNNSISRDEFQSGLRKLLHGTPLLGNVEGWEPLMWRLMDEDNTGSISSLQLGAALTVIDKGDPRLTQNRMTGRSHRQICSHSVQSSTAFADGTNSRGSAGISSSPCSIYRKTTP